MLQGLSKLELTDVAMMVSAGTSGLSLSWASFTIGAPGSRWNVWKDVLAVEQLGLRINVIDPLGLGGRRSMEATLWGTTVIEGVPIEIVLVVQSLIVLFIAAPPLVRTIFRLPDPSSRRRAVPNVSQEVKIK